MARLRGASMLPGRELPAVLLPPVIGDWVDWPDEFADIADEEERWSAATAVAWRRWHVARLEWARVHGGLSSADLRRRFPPDQVAVAVTADGLLNDGDRVERANG